MSSNPLMMGYGGGDWRCLASGRVATQACVCRLCVGSGLCGRRLRARDESALEVAPPDRRLDRRLTAFTTMRYTNRQPFLPLSASDRTNRMVSFLSLHKNITCIDNVCKSLSIS